MGTVLDRAVRLTSYALRRWLHPRRSKAQRRLLPRLEAAGLDPGYIRVVQPETFQKLEEKCDACTHVARCSGDLEASDPNERLASYCSNTPAIDELVVARVLPSVSTKSRSEKHLQNWRLP